MSASRPRTTSFVEGGGAGGQGGGQGGKGSGSGSGFGGGLKISSSRDGSKVMTVISSPGQGPDRSTEVSYTDTKARYFNILRFKEFTKLQLSFCSENVLNFTF